ncbi:hypothetical protein F4677DRAFT_439390 [Hypoxylon crocopeplum]|nr:hypothetical protein F4677DRAFT_439390 [Hypoxylon crocopeplum]
MWRTPGPCVSATHFHTYAQTHLMEREHKLGVPLAKQVTMDDTRGDEPTEVAEPQSSRLVWTAERNAYTLSASAVETNSVADLRESLSLAQEFLPKFDTDYIQFRDEVFSSVLSIHSLPLLTYMLDNEGVPISAVTPNSVFSWASKPLIEVLVTRGWDVNAQDNSAFAGKRLIDYLIRTRYGKEDLARWLVEEKGAAVDGGQDVPNHSRHAQPPPILETCAAFGTVSMLKFLEGKGAGPSRRMLHVAAEVAAGRGADPDSDHPAQGPGADAKDASVEMLRYLVDERGLDVNGIDSGAPPGLANTSWGTPLCYAARCRDGAPVVRWLLKKGADPSIKRPHSSMDALACAREAGCDEVLNVLEDWQRTRN